MPAGCSYHHNAIGVGSEQEIRRLDAQVELFWEKERAVYARHGLLEATTVLDCGCGTGRLIALIGEWRPELMVTGLEVDPYLALKARTAFSTSGVRARILAGSVSAIPFADDMFDAALSRLVMEHLPDPVSAMREVCRILKPGGTAFFLDNDFDLHPRTYPDIPELQALYRAYCAARIEEGGNPCIGRRLPVLMNEAGFSNLDLEVICVHSTLIGDEAFARSEGSGIALQLVKTGHLDSEVYDTLIKRWSAMVMQPGHALVRLLFIGIGRKPLTDAAGVYTPANEVTGHSLPDPGIDLRQAAQAGALVPALAAIVARILEIGDAAAAGMRLLDIGMDSIGATMLSASIEASLPVKSPSAEYLFTHSLTEIANELERRLAEVGRATDRLFGDAPVSAEFEEGML